MEELLRIIISFGIYAIIPVLIIIKRLHTRHISKTFKSLVEEISTSHAHANERTTWYGQSLNQAENAWFYFYLNAKRKKLGQLYYIYGHHSAPIKDFPPLELKPFGGCAQSFAMRIVASPTAPTPQLMLSGTPEDVLRTLFNPTLGAAINATLATSHIPSELIMTLSVTPSALMLRLDLQEIKELRAQLNEITRHLPKLYAIHDGFKGMPLPSLELKALQAALNDEAHRICHRDLQTFFARHDPLMLPQALQDELGASSAPMHVRMGHAWSAPERYRGDHALLKWLAAQAGPDDPSDEQLTTPSERLYPIDYIQQLLCHISIHFVATATGIIPHHLQATTLHTMSQTMSPAELEQTLLSAFDHSPAIPAMLWSKLVHHALIDHRELLVSCLLKHELRCTHEQNLNLLDDSTAQPSATHEPLLLELLERAAPWRLPTILNHLASVGTGLSYTALSQSALMSTHTKQTHKTLNAILRRHKRLENEHIGSLSLSDEQDDQHGALSLSQDAGALAMVDPRDDEQR